MYNNNKRLQGGVQLPTKVGSYSSTQQKQKTKTRDIKYRKHGRRIQEGSGIQAPPEINQGAAPSDLFS